MPASRETPPSRSGRVERLFETGLFASRWLMAPFYFGLAAALLVLLIAFARELIEEVPHILTGAGMTEQAILLALSLVDLTLAGNLLLIVMFSGYESFVSKMDIAGHEDRPDWMGKVDFSGLKMKLIASIVAISAISLLKTFMQVADQPIDEARLKWQVAIHLAFVTSGAVLAIMDWLESLAAKNEAAAHGEH
jgi:uncharacterized protein (TIGR00645 family)